MKKIIILTVFALMLMATPLSTRASFDPTCIIDPFSLFACDDDEPQVVNTTVNNSNTNSNNVNSNINSPNSNVVTTPEVVTVPVYVYDYNYDYDYDYNNNYNYDNYNNNNNNNNNNYSQLGVSCYPTSTRIGVGDSVTWRASAYGGNNDYNITWSGTNGLDGYGSSISKRYNSEGGKSASVKVTSAGQTVHRNCGTVEVEDYRDNNYNNNYDYNYRDYDYDRDYNSNSSLSVSCSVNASFAPVGTRVTWQAYASGGSGSYKYEWYGSDSIRGSGRNLETFYNSPGTKTAYVVVRSGSKSVTQYCTNSVLVGVPNTYTNPVYTPPTTIIKYVEAPVKKEVVKETPAPIVEKGSTLASLFSLENVPWGWVAVLVILVLLVTIIYLVYNEKKI